MRSNSEKDMKNVQDIIALSPMQEGLLYHYLKNPGSRQYIEQLRIDVSGEYDEHYFRQAWNHVTGINEMLRTAFRWKKIARPVQVIFKSHETDLHYYDFSGFTPTEAVKQADKLLEQDLENAFDLNEVPFRVILCKIESTKYRLIISNHHILYDGWSNGIILREFLSAYTAMHKGDDRLIVPGKPGFKEYIRWLNRQVPAPGEDFWRRHLAGWRRQPGLPLNRRTASPEPGSGTTGISLPRELTRRLEELSKKYKVTLAALLYSSWGMILQRYNNCDDIVFGTTVSGRNAKIKGIEHMVGLFINTVPIRISTSPRDRFIDLAENINRILQEREPFEHTALPDILSRCGLEGRGEPFDSIIAIENYPLDRLLESESFPWKLDAYSMEEQTHYPLTLSVTLRDGIQLNFIYRESLLNKEYVQQIASHWVNLLERGGAEPERLAADFDFLGEEEKESLLNGFNRTDTAFDHRAVVTQLFSDRVLKTPDAVAVAVSPRVSYRELDERSTRLAAVLRQNGVVPGDIVSIVESRRVEDIIGILAILKVGAAYLPMLPNYPRERLNFILADSGSRLILSSGELPGIPDSEADVLSLDLCDSEGIEDIPSVAAEACVVPSRPAYVLYTSGTTGRPKGVVVEHRSVANLLFALQKEYPALPGDGFLLKTPLVFDVSVSELFGWILGGAGLALLEQGGEKDPREIIAAIENGNVTHINFVPSMFGAFLYEWNRSGKDKSLSLKHIFLAGETLLPGVVEEFERMGTGVRLHNIYGPTENTVYATYYPLAQWEGGSIPIGKPLPNIKVFIIDNHNRLQPVGAPGELCLGGHGMARGYLNRGQLTLEAFTSNPFFPQEKVYRTGDLAMWRQDGNIEFIGRIDQQVKIRGYRIELGDIENNLLAHEHIKETAVTMVGDGRDAYLCAYVVGDRELDFASIREYLSEKMPDYMIPGFFTAVDRLPKTASGKIDRNNLPKPDVMIKNPYIAPRNDIENILVQIWAQVLQLEPSQIGIDHGFFQLGGHSLKTIALGSRIHKEFNVELPLTRITELSTIRKLAAHMQTAERALFKKLEPVERRCSYSLSSAQTRLFAMHYRTPSSTAYNMTAALELTGELDAVKLEESLRSLIHRHESLRSSFGLYEEGPRQKIHETVSFSIEFIKIGGDEPADHWIEEQIKRFVRPFDLLAAPLFRVGLITSQGERHVLIVDLHHIIADGASLDILMDDLNAIHSDRQLPPLRIQYKDFVYWQNERRNSENLQKQAQYWWNIYRTGLELPVLNLPTDKKRPEEADFSGGTVEIMIDGFLTSALRQIGAAADTSLFVVLLAAFNIFLSKLCRQQDIVIGCPVQGRTHKDLEHIIGMFVNTLALRNQPHGTMRTREFIALVRENFLQALENQDYLYEDLVNEIVQPVNPGRNPLFDVMMTFQDSPGNKLSLPGLDVVPFPLETSVSKFDLTLACIDKEIGIQFVMTYNRALFKESTVFGFLANIKQVLLEVAAHPHGMLQDIEMISSAEKERILNHFNQTRTAFEQDKSIDQIFRDQAARTPDNIAVKGEVSLTYREVLEKSDRLANVIRKLGTAGSSIVCIVECRTQELILGILAILKAGCTYLPIRHSFPQEQINYILQDSGSRLILSCRELKGIRVPLVDVVRMDDLAIYLAPGISEKETYVRFDSSQSAYVIYTSGSTGPPKGVVISHQSVVNLLFAMQKEYPVKPGDVYLLKTPLVFDVSVSELFGWIPGGGSLAILERGGEKDPGKIIHAILSWKITHINFVPSMFGAFLNAWNRYGAGKLVSLKFIFLAGEVLLPELAERFAQMKTGVSLYNMYGPTENTVFATLFPLSQWNGKGNIPIGKPLDNIKVYILDQDNRLLPAGVPGELCLGGDGMAYGYMNSNQLTHEKFTPNPFTLGEKMYHTGDLALWRDDGNIEFIGRLDNQVKIRGVRIELGSIENNLLKHPKIKEASVKMFGEGHNAYLCAYVAGEPDLDTQKIKEYLTGKMPGYMVPDFYSRVESLPLTASGKVDLNALPEPVFHSQEKYVAPRNDVEEKMVRIWSELLQLEPERIGIDDCFLRLGGHSIKSIELTGRIRAEFKVWLSLTQIRDLSTIRRLAAHVQGGESAKFEPVTPVEKRVVYPLSSAQMRLFAIQQRKPASRAYNMSAALELTGPFRIEPFNLALQKIVDRHESFRTAFEMVRNQPVQKIEGSVAIEIEVYESSRDGVVLAKVEEIVDAFVRPFDLSKAPLCRVGLIKSADTRYILMIDMHHIISDGASVDILIDDLNRLYAGEELPALDIQYKDFALWQIRLRDSKQLEEQARYWTGIFPPKEEIPILHLPADFSRPAEQDFTGSTVEADIGEALARAIQNLATSTGTTPYVVLLSAFNVMLSKLCGQEDIVVGTPVLGRTHRVIESVIGMFVNTLALRNRPLSSIPMAQFIAVVNSHFLKALENQDYPYENVVDDAAGNGTLTGSSLFNVMLTYRDKPVKKLVLPNINITPLPYRRGISKFDLVLNCTEKDNRICLELSYSTALFKTATAHRFLNYFKRILTGCTGHPDYPLAQIQLIGVEEKEHILYRFNTPLQTVSRRKTLPQLFQEQVIVGPDRIALVFEDSHLTYRRLNARANSLAHYLRDRGVAGDTIVALMVDRSFQMIVAMLAVLKAGGAYLPIDPAYPVKRKQYMLTDSRSPFLVCRGTTSEDIEVLAELTEIIDMENTPGNRENETDPELVNGPEDLAYCIYTSGSTGRPRGVLIRHANAVNVVSWFARKYRLGEGVNVLQMSDYTFDPSVNQVFGSLLHGAQLHLVSKKMLLRTPVLREYIREHCIHILNFVPLLLHELLTAGPRLESVKYVLSGGEALSDKIKNDIIAAGYAVFNQYGPTETAIDALVEKCSTLPVTLGTPIDNTGVYILDKDDNLSPIGIPGEICVTGAGIARGYLNDPERTAAAFTINSFEPGMLMYRTGDLGRWLPDGKIHFSGRKDFQVKIRGYRVELGEIENRLRRIGGIDDAVVIARRKEENRSFYLCAYIMTTKSFKEEAIKERLAAELPDYMIPSYFISLEFFPVTPSGKIDRSALPEPETLSSFLSPRDDIEELLTGIWAGVLGIEKGSISMDANFFELGGHSLKAVVVAQKIHKQLEVKIPMSEVFKRLTIEDLAEFVRKSVKDKYLFIEPAREQEYYPLSSAQKRLFILQQMETRNVNYNMPGVRVLEGELDREKMEIVFNRLIRRHESLRTSFHLVDEEPVCKIHPPDAIDFKIDYYKLSPGQNEDEAVNDTVKPFQLSQPPLVRVRLIRTQPLRHLLVIDKHHIITDGTSFTLFMKDFMALYKGETLKPLRVQYKDHTVWQNRFAGTDVRNKQESFWLKEFSGDIPVLDLPTDFKRHRVQNYDGSVMEFSIAPVETKYLKALAVKADATLYMVLLALFNILLSKLSGQEDIVIGSPVEGRSHEDLHHIIGMFVNTLPIRNYPRRKLSFSRFLARVKEQSLAAFENQDYPFEELVEKVMGNINRDASRNPLFDVMFGLQNMEIVALEIPGLTLRSYPAVTLSSKFDLSFHGFENGDSLHFTLEYASRLFKEESIRRFVSYFRKLVAAVIATPEKTIGDIDILPVEERQRILMEFNGTRVDYPAGATITEVFVRQVVRFTDKIALTAPSTGDDKVVSFTYGQLNEKVNRLADILIRQGVVPGSPVALLVDRSIQMVISILAVLKTGGAYLPIDPAFPQQRIQYTFADSSARWLLTQSHYLGQAAFDGNVIDVDDISGHTGSPLDPRWEGTAEEPAYIIYTSGSTGKPKGVSVSHRAILNTLYHLSEAYPCTRSDAYLLKTPYIFDVSLSEICGWFIGGGSLVVLEKDAQKNPAKILDIVVRYDVTHLNFVPSMFHAFLDYLQQYSISGLGRLKYIFLAGEALHGEMVSAFRSLNRTVVLENIYGPTEAAVYASSFPLKDWHETDNIPIGKPLSNIRLYILDTKQRLLPIGSVGELYISGPGLAQGYLNRPLLTHQRFVPDCFVQTKPAEPLPRMYKTGDLARWLPDGNVQFLGRTDHQVKIRGYRIELGEITNALLAFPGVKDAIVTARQDQGNGSYLCAYFVSNPEISLAVDHSELQRFLAKTLPEYMIPAFFVPLEQIPLNVSGKPDMAVLPAPDIGESGHIAAPRDEVEQALVKLWAELLGVDEDRIGIDTSFFKLGGHSLKATIMVSRIHKTFLVQIPLVEVFKAPVIRELAAYIKQAGKGRFVAINPAEKREHYPLASSQKRLYVLQLLEPASVAYNITAVMKITGKLNIENFSTALEQLVKRFDILRIYYGQHRNEPVQILHPDSAIKVEYEESDEERLDDILLDFVRPFDLSRAPLFRVGLVKTGADRHVMILDTHHIILDGTSMTLLMEHLIALYAGNPLPLPRLQYLDFCIWQEGVLSSDTLEQQKQYWIEQFAQPLPVLDMPTDFPRASVQSFTGERIYSQLNEEITRRLGIMIDRTDTTLFMVMLAVLNVLLSWYSQQEDIIVGTAIAGRYHADLEDMVGLLMETMALRNKPTADKPFFQFLEEVKINTLAAYENHAYPFMEVLMNLGLENDFSRNPLFDVLMILQNTDRPNLELDDITITECPGESGDSKADIFLVITETGDTIQLIVEYCTKLYKRETIETFLHHFITVVNQVLDQPAIRLKDIEIISDPEKEQLLESMHKKYNTGNRELGNARDDAVLEAEFNF